MKVIFVGTSEFAVPIFKKLLDSRFDVILLVCQPDRAKGRKKLISPPPTKLVAIEKNIPIFQPEKLKNSDSIDFLRSLGPDVFITASYGQILSSEVLAIPKLACFNVHSSVLPLYRGASPIRWAIINGETETGVTIYKMDPGMDTGDVFAFSKLTLKDYETHDELHDRLAVLGADLAVKLLDALSSGAPLKLIPQDNTKATLAPILKKSDGLIDWNKSSKDIEQLIRGLFPWPGTFTYLNGKKIKINAATVLEEKLSYLVKEKAGSLYKLDKNRGIGVVCGEGCLELVKVQPENKKEQTSKDLLSGLHGSTDGLLFGDLH